MSQYKAPHGQRDGPARAYRHMTGSEAEGGTLFPGSLELLPPNGTVFPGPEGLEAGGRIAGTERYMYSLPRFCTMGEA